MDYSSALFAGVAKLSVRHPTSISSQEKLNWTKHLQAMSCQFQPIRSTRLKFIESVLLGSAAAPRKRLPTPIFQMQEN